MCTRLQPLATKRHISDPEMRRPTSFFEALFEEGGGGAVTEQVSQGQETQEHESKE
jgi:hypothetical protein